MDPYQVLGISQNASDEEVKRAYRELARKYHPDKYIDNPLADLAQEKMKAINEAYDTIMKERLSGANAYRTDSASSGTTNDNTDYRSGTSGYRDSRFSRARQMIDAGNLDGAEALLRSINLASAEYYFLTGCIALKRGWYDDARQNLQTAAAMEPNNIEYQSALKKMHGVGDAYRSNTFSDTCGSTSCCKDSSGCDICSGLLALDCCCECMGGDLIPCC